MAFLKGLFSSPDVEAMVSEGDVDGLLNALGYKRDASVRDAAAEALGQMGVPAIGPLVTSMRTTEDDAALQEVYRALAIIGEPTVEPLLEVLKDPDEAQRSRAVSALAKIGVPAVDPLIIAMTRSHPPRWRNIAAATVLGMIGARITDEDLRWTIVKELACLAVFFGGPKPRGWPSGRCGTWHSPELEKPCLQSLLWIGDVRTLQLLALVPMERGTYPTEKEVFVRICEKAGDQAIEPLIDILDSALPKREGPRAKPERNIPASRLSIICGVLSKITNQDFGDDIVAWLEWWKNQQ